MVVEWRAEERQRALRSALASSAYSDAQRRTLGRLQQRWVLRDLTVSTRIQYVQSAKRLALHLGKPLEEATREELEALLSKTAAELSHRSFRSAQVFLKIFYKDLLAPDADAYPPLVSWIRVGKMFKCSKLKLPEELLTPDEVRAMATVTPNPRDGAIEMALYESAARMGELRGLRIKDTTFDEYGARLTLTGKTGSRKVRLINSVLDLQRWLENHPARGDPNAPLFYSWNATNRFGALRYDGYAKSLKRAARNAGIKKKVHPHLFRHSRLTELARDLSESELKVFAGWTPDSPMARIYIHLSGDDVDRKILEKAGLLNRDEAATTNPLAPRVCPRCQAQNAATSEFCSTCTLDLDPKRAMAGAAELERLEERLPALQRLLEDLQIARLIAMTAGEATDALRAGPSPPTPERTPRSIHR